VYKFIQMDSKTELYLRHRSMMLLEEADKYHKSILEAKGVKKQKGLEIYSLLVRSHLYQEDAINQALYSDRKLKNKEYELALKDQELKKAYALIKDLKKFMTHE